MRAFPLCVVKSAQTITKRFDLDSADAVIEGLRLFSEEPAFAWEEPASVGPAFYVRRTADLKNVGPRDPASVAPAFYVRRTADLKNVGPRYPASGGPAFTCEEPRT